MSNHVSCNMLDGSGLVVGAVSRPMGISVKLDVKSEIGRPIAILNSRGWLTKLFTMKDASAFWELLLHHQKAPGLISSTRSIFIGALIYLLCIRFLDK